MRRDAERDERFTAFVNARGQALARTAFLLCGGRDADDLVQDALVATLRAWDRFDSLDAAEAYARRVVTNRCISRWRHRGRHPEVPLGDPDRAALPERAAAGTSGTADVENRVEDRVVETLSLWPVVRALPERQRAVVVLRFYEGLTEAEVADVLGCSVGTVKSYSFRALRACRAALTTTGRGPADRLRPVAGPAALRGE